MPWKVVDVDIPEEEATVNWSAQDQSSALYKVDELAKIISDGDDCGLPINISTAVSAGAFCISISNEVHIFDGEQYNILATLSLESSVETMVWSPDSQFLVIGDNSGTIHFFSFTCGDVVFSTNLVDVSKESDHISPVFCNSKFNTNEDNSSVNLVILSADGCLFTFNKLPLRGLSAALKSKDLATIKKLKENIQMEVCKVSEMHDGVSYCSVAMVCGMSSFIIAGSGHAAISLWSDNNVMDTIDCELLGADARKCQVSPDGKYLVVLDEHSNLSVWDAHILVMLSVPRSRVKDFAITSSATAGEADAIGSDKGQVVLLADNGSEKTTLEIYQFPCFQKTYSLEISQGCSLAESSCYQEKVFYIEENTSNNNTAELMYKCLSESSPEHRVYNLVRKKKFDSALEFSKAFGLDIEFVYKAKASTILAEISTKISESDESLDERSVSVDELIKELQDSLENVKSVEFCVNCCLNASAPPKLEQVYRLLCFAKEKVGRVSDKVKHKYNSEMMDILHSIHRLETFKMVFGDACYTVHRWRQFSNCDMLSQVMQFLCQGKMSSAAIVWRRHQSELEEKLTAESLKSVLANIRSDLPSSSVISWLKAYLIPFVICCPDNKEALFVIASWLEQRITSLEISEKEDWPSNGLEMAKLLFDVHSQCVEESSNYENVPTPLLVNHIYGSATIQICKRLGKPNPISSLSLMVEHITELEKLHANYHCKIPLAEFTKETPLGIMFKMLDSVLAIELIQSVVNSQIMQYGIQHGFQIDDVLLKYISNQVKQVSVSNLSNTLYEARLVEIAKCIKERALRFEAILQLMSWAKVPWSGVVEEMVQKAMIEEPSNEKLKSSYCLMELKKILSHYGLRGIEFSNDSHVKGVVEYILGTSNETALEDALQFVETYHSLTEEEVYAIRLQNLCVKSPLSECIKSLKMVSKPQVISVVKRFLIWVSVMLQDLPVDGDDSQERISIMEAAVCILEHLRDIQEISNNMKTTLEDLKNILALQSEFSIFISISDYRDVDTREEFLFGYIKRRNMAMSILTKKDEGGNDCYVAMSRLARLFGLSFVQLQSKILLHSAADPVIYSNTVMSCKEWLKSMTHELSSEEIFNLCTTILQNHISQEIDTITSTEVDVPEMLYGLACCALTCGKTGSINSYLELCKLCWLSTSFSNHCESGGLSLSTSVCEEDPLQSWNNAHWFKDNGFVLDAIVALPLQYMVLGESMSVQENPQEHLEKLTIACRNLVGYLQENNLHELAIQHALHCLSHLLQFSAIDNGSDKSTEQQSDVESVQKNPKLMLLNTMGLHGCNHVATMLVSLFSKVLQSSSIDQDLALGYLCSIPEDTALLNLKSDFAVGQSHNPSKVITVFSVALYYATHFCHPSAVKAVEELYSAALWYSRLTKHHIACGSLLTGGEKEAKKVLEVLLEKPGIDVKMIVEFCKSFDIEVDDVMHSYIHNAASESYDPAVITSINKFEDQFLCAINYVENVTDLKCLLEKVLESVSPYDYERIAIILNELIKLSDNRNETQFGRQLEVLTILVKYKRSVSPCEYEKHYHTSSNVKEHTEFSNKSSQERLPFHPLIYGSPWKIIAPELNDKTTPKLLPLCRLLKLQEDQVYVNAVNNLVSSCLVVQQPDPAFLVPTSSSTQVELTSCQFEKAATLLSAVKNPEVAIKTAITLLRKWPQSEEKFKAANATVELAFKWLSSSEGKERQTAETIYKIAKENAQEISIEHILLSGGVTEESFLNFKHKPVKLVMHLYKVYGCAPEADRPNIHKIASEIATISNLNINRIHSHLLETWIYSAYPGSIRSPEYSSSENKANDQENLKRVMYLLEDDSLQNKHAMFLLNFAYKSGQSKISNQSRVRALEILFNVASHEVIVNLANDTLDGIRNYMKSLFYLSELEHLHLPQTLESFQRCNKEGLVKGLWKNRKDDANAILLIADICLDSKICDPQVWTNILRQLLHLGLTKYLCHLLPLLTKFPNLWQTSNLMKIWEELAFQPMQKAVGPLSAEDRCLCKRSILLLQRCPIMVEVDILRVFQKLVELGLLSYALACFSLLPPSKKPSCLKSLILPDDVNNILDAIAEDETLGHGFVSPSVVETLVFEHVIASSLYEPFIGSNHVLKLADYLIAEKKFHQMVMEIIKLGDIEFAVELAHHYEMCGSPFKKKLYLKKHEVVGLNDLLCFLDSAGVLEEALPYLPAFEDPEERPMLELANPDGFDEQASASDVDIFDVF